MGWDAIPMKRPRAKAERVQCVLYDFLWRWTPETRPQVLDYAERNGAIFCKMLHPASQTQLPRLWVAIIQYEFADGELWVRVDDNTVGSIRTDCPARILRGVPIYGRSDAEWRAQCAARRRKK